MHPTYSESSQTPDVLPMLGRTYPGSPTISPHIRSDRGHRENICHSNEPHTSWLLQCRESTPGSSSPNTFVRSCASIRIEPSGPARHSTDRHASAHSQARAECTDVPVRR